MPRQNTKHTPDSLRGLVRLMREAALNIEELAELMAENRVGTVSLAHQVALENGVMAARRMAREGVSKIEDDIGPIGPRRV